MARPSTKDPLDKFRFQVNVDGFTRLGFTAVETPTVTLTTKNYAEGGNHLFPKKIIETVSYSAVTLMRGVTSDRSFNEWATSYFRLISNIPDPLLNNSALSYRRNVTITHLDRAGRTIRTYTLYNAFPTEYKPASDFSADGDDSYSLEKLVLEYESFDVTIAGQKYNPFQVNDLVKRLTRNF
jgi:phage tail-like protein